MKNILILLLSFCFIESSIAQKKIIPVTQSPLTGITLPNGSKQDSRMLSVAGAKFLLEIESKKANVTLSATEVLVLPPVSAGGFNADSLVAKFTGMGWTISVIEGDNKYAWLQKDTRNLIMYFSMDAKETGLYFGEAASAPVQNGQVNNTTTTAPATTDNNQTQQTYNPPVQNNQVDVIQQPGIAIQNSGFAFTTTNFDDGWTSTVQEDWVETTKGNIKVLIHYPNKKADEYNSVLLDGLKNAWDILVAPRYSSASNFEFKPLQSWQSIEFAEADMVEKATGNTVHVVFFKKNYSGGGGKYLELITTTKNIFEQEFGAYVKDDFAPMWDKIAAMASYNKFAVGASDLTGKWTSNFTGMTQYVNAYTGASAGADTHASNENFEFAAGNTYKWNIGVASGFVGNIKFQGAKSEGQWSLVNNWQIHFSEIEKKEKTYNAYFSCIKGARILWLQDTGYGGYSSYGKAE